MKKLTVAIIASSASAAVLAGHADSLSFQSVPVLNEVGLFMLAITAALAGAWGIRRLRDKD